MEKHVRVLITSAFILACGAVTANAQQSGSRAVERAEQQETQQQGADQDGCGMMGHGGMMGRGMMGRGGMMGRSMMGHGGMMGRSMMGQGGMMGPVIMRIIFALMDSDGDGTISLQEFQAAHERIFKAMDTNKDGRLTLEEMQVFMRGTRGSVPQQ